MKPTPELITLSLEHLEADLAFSPGNRNLFTANGQIPNKYKGYISSFGGSIVQLGVMPACMAFIANEDKMKITDALFSIYCIKHNIHGVKLKSYLIGNWQNWTMSQKKQFRNRISAIAVSFKLAMRTFEFEESDNE